MKVILLALFLSIHCFALSPEEQQPDEIFSSYFARITRGGSFSGIYLKAPETFAKNFNTYIRKNNWMRDVSVVEHELQALNYDLWFDIYSTIMPQKFIKMSEHFTESSGTLTTYCQKNIEYLNLSWSAWPQCLRRAWIDEALFTQGAAAKLAALYKLDLTDVLKRTQIFLLNTSDFEIKIREAGWNGPIYFRAATMPDPQNKLNRWILLNDDFLKKYTGFDRPVLQMLEIAGIANHELSHVMQDFSGQKLGLDIQVRSAEQLLLIEGQAEFLAEESFKDTNIFFKLFAAQQAVEVMNRQGQQAEQFPYTVGLPFATTLYKTGKNYDQVTEDILQILGQDTSLSDYLFKHY